MEDSLAPRRLEVGILGATGMVGQQFVLQLAAHPWFRIAWLGASQRSEGRKYRDLSWRLAVPLPGEVADMVVESPAPGRAPRLIFSALDAAVAGELEQAFAAAGHTVVSNARNYRMEQSVPLLIPEVNPDHLGLIATQQRAKGWKGTIVTNPNCSTVVLALSLARRQFGKTVTVPPPASQVLGTGCLLDILGNVVRYRGEEERRDRDKKLKAPCEDIEGATAVVLNAQTTQVPCSTHTEMVVSLGTASRRVMAPSARFRTSPARPAQHTPCLHGAGDRPQPGWMLSEKVWPCSSGSASLFRPGLW